MDKKFCDLCGRKIANSERTKFVEIGRPNGYDSFVRAIVRLEIVGFTRGFEGKDVCETCATHLETSAFKSAGVKEADAYLKSLPIQCTEGSSYRTVTAE